MAPIFVSLLFPFSPRDLNRERGGVLITPKFEILKSKTEVPIEVVWKI